MALLVALMPLSVFAQTAKPADTAKAVAKPAESAKPADTAKAAVKPAESAKPAPAAVSTVAPAANMLAVCGCGMTFVPDAKTQYLESGGKKYACCSEGCYKMSMADPAKAAKMADENMAKVMTQLNPPKH
ncbi:MAG TPA: hypothetical protein VNA25_02160 [Phycisphaerae bacterium]|nr:hypothetical protein [Phycisphaerae bacterium]